MANMNKMLKQAQKMQAEIMKVQQEAEKETAEATTGGGMVKAVANGKQQVVEIKIDPQVVDPDDVEMLEDLILAAVSEAQRKALEAVEAKMSKITGGMNIPGMF